MEGLGFKNKYKFNVNAKWQIFFFELYYLFLLITSFTLNERKTLREKQPIGFQSSLEVTGQIGGKWKTKKPTFMENLATHGPKPVLN